MNKMQAEVLAQVISQEGIRLNLGELEAIAVQSIGKVWVVYVYGNKVEVISENYSMWVNYVDEKWPQNKAMHWDSQSD